MQWLSIILGAGGVAFFTAIAQAVQQWRKSSSERQRRLMNEMERLKNEARSESDWYADLADYWRGWAGVVEYEASKAGVTLPPRPPLPNRPLVTKEGTS